MESQPLLTPVRMGKVELRNRIIMAPMTRMRAANTGYVPTQLHAQYYAQRATAGLIIGEGTETSPDAYGWAESPGLWSSEQVQGWRRVTDTVHEKGCSMYIQLWHTRAMSHPDFFGGALPMSASAVNPEQESVTPSGRKPTVAPRPMSKAEIRQTVAEFGVAAKNALEAGFDGVPIQANYLETRYERTARLTTLRSARRSSTWSAPYELSHQKEPPDPPRFTS